MNAVNWVLMHLGEAIGAVWALLVEGLTTVGRGLDWLLNPILAPTLGVLNPICTAIGDGVYWVLGFLPPWIGLTILSALTGVLMLLVFRRLSNQDAIVRVKDEIKANLLTLRLYKDDLRVTLRAQGRLFVAVAKFQRYVLPPVLIVLPPMLLGLAQMGVRHQWRPLRPGESSLLKVRFADGVDLSVDPGLEPGSGLTVEAGPVPGGGEVIWRVRAGDVGRHLVHVEWDGSTVDKEVVVGDGFQRVNAIRANHRWTTMLLHPTESSLPANSPIESIEIVYPHVDSWITGADYWVVYFFIVSMVAALMLKPVFKVQF